MSAVLFLVLSQVLSFTMALLLAFNGGVLVFLIAAAVSMLDARPERMPKLARQQEEGKWAVLLISLV